MIDDHRGGVVELDGLWLNKGRKLVKVAGSMLSEDYIDEDLLKAENDQVGEKHWTGLNDIKQGGSSKIDRQTASDEEEEVCWPTRIERRYLKSLLTRQDLSQGSEEEDGLEEPTAYLPVSWAGTISLGRCSELIMLALLLKELV